MPERILGAIPSPTDVRDYRIATVAGDLPTEYSCEHVKIKNQGGVGSCVAHALAEVVEWHAIHEGTSDESRSTDFIYGNRRNTAYKNVGMVVREAIASIVKYGDCLEVELPGNHEVPKSIEIFEKNVDSLRDIAYPYRFSAYVRLNGEKEIKTALMNYGPVVIVAPWFEDIHYDNGVLDSASRANAGGSHCMVIYGWDADGWLVQNSWGIRWGNKGCCTMPYDFPFSEAWGIIDDIRDDSYTKPFKSKLGSLLARFINWLVNSLRKS